jgi:NAD(P)-dependent dehydrogenase (short-subunit alcohol dehydrogenase family)
MEKLSGKTALVTGSTDGVGRLVARKLGQAAGLHSSSRRPEEPRYALARR